MIAPMAAIVSKDVSFIVMMAGTGLPGDEVIALQTDLLLKAQGAEDEGRRLTRDLFAEVFAILKKEGRQHRGGKANPRNTSGKDGRDD